MLHDEHMLDAQMLDAQVLNDAQMLDAQILNAQILDDDNHDACKDQGNTMMRFCELALPGGSSCTFRGTLT